jgi:hypothetical protein
VNVRPATMDARATPGVDAANPTGGTHLNESVGTCVEQEDGAWGKALP